MKNYIGTAIFALSALTAHAGYQEAPAPQQSPCAEQDKSCEQGQLAPTEQQEVVIIEQKASRQEGKLVELRDVNHKFAAKSVEGAVIRTNLDGTMSLLLEVKVKSGLLGLFSRTENRVVTLPIVSRLRDACGTEITVARLDTRIGSAGLYEELVLKDHRFDSCSTMPHLTEVTYTTIDPSFRTTISHFAGYALVDGR